MINFFKNNLKFLTFLVIFGLIGGYFTALYGIEMLSPENIEDAISQVGSIEALIAITTLQSLFYAVILGLIGKAIAEKIGLPLFSSIEIKPILSVLAISVFGGAFFILGDLYLFGGFNEVIRDSYLVKPTLNYIIASVTYGGVIEEVITRLFFMSLLAFIFVKLSGMDYPSDKQLVIANLIVAFIFAAGHLPATAQSIGLDAVIVIRCFLMNGAYGLAFGRMYRKYGIQYAMLAHAGVHIVSKIIWLIFI